jgi:hypothetical protein
MKIKIGKERGQALILIAFAALALFAIVGLAIDGSNRYSDRRHAQNAADAAALAGALEKATGMTNGLSDCACPPASGPIPAFCQDILTKARQRTDQNGYNGDLATNQVEVYSPPKSGPYTGQCYYVQVKITSYVDTYFTRVLGINQSTNIVESTAYAGKGGILGDGAMLVSYDPAPGCSAGVGSGGGSFDVSGDSKITLKGGGIFINSGKTCGYYAPSCPQLTITSGAGINSAATVDNIEQNDSVCADKMTLLPESINKSPIKIPEDINFPKEPPECKIAPAAQQIGVAPDGKGEWLIHPGYYEVFPQATLVENKQHIYMESGVYCIDPGGPTKDFDLSWSPTDFVSLNGSTNPSKNKYANLYNRDGVTLYIKSGGGFTINDNNPTFFDASSTGDYQGYLIVLNGDQSSIEDCSITGGADIDLNGMIFAPYCKIKVNGQSDSIAEINAQLIGWDFIIDGKAGINFTYDPKYAVKIKRKVGLMK